MRSPDLPQKYSFDPCGHDARGPARQGCPRHMRRYFEEPQCGLLFGFWGGGSGVRLRRWGVVVVVVGHKIQKLKVAAFMARLVRFGCCGARSQLSFYHIITFKLVRSAEIEPPGCLSESGFLDPGCCLSSPKLMWVRFNTSEISQFTLCASNLAVNSAF